MNKGLTYDWNRESPAARPPVVMLDDETLRDGLQSPSVRTPTIDQKLHILHLLHRIGVDTADIGLPGAGAHVVRDVERLAREIVDGRMKIQANCAARTTIGDVQPIAEIQQRTGLPIECCCFIGSSPIRRYAEDWTVDHLQRCTEDAIAFAIREGLRVMYVTEDTTRSDPETLRRLFTTAVHAGASRICIADTVGHATPDGARALVRFAKQTMKDAGAADIGIDWHGHNDRGIGTANSLFALEAGASRVHGTILGIGERVGNTPLDLLMVNLVLLGWIERDLTRLNDLVQAVSEATGEPVPDNSPVFGRDAFRTATSRSGSNATAWTPTKRWSTGSSGARRARRRCRPNRKSSPRWRTRAPVPRLVSSREPGASRDRQTRHTFGAPIVEDILNGTIGSMEGDDDGLAVPTLSLLDDQQRHPLAGFRCEREKFLRIAILDSQCREGRIQRRLLASDDLLEFRPY